MKLYKANNGKIFDLSRVIYMDSSKTFSISIYLETHTENLKIELTYDDPRKQTDETKRIEEALWKISNGE